MVRNGLMGWNYRSDKCIIKEQYQLQNIYGCSHVCFTKFLRGGCGDHHRGRWESVKCTHKDAYSKQESPPAWMQEAYCPPCSKSLGWGYPTLARGVPTLAGGGTQLGQGVPTLAGGGYLPWLEGGTYLGWDGVPPMWTDKQTETITFPILRM